MIRLLGLTLAVAATVSLTRHSESAETTLDCPADTTGLKLPSGFCATLFADSLAAPRQMDVAPNGDVIVGLRGSRPQGSTPIPGGVAILRDANRDGRAESRTKFGDSSTTTAKLVGTALFVETGRSILRYRLPAGAMTPTGKVDTIVSGLPVGSHAAKTFVVHNGQLYVNHGSGTNSCQEKDRTAESKGLDPCPELSQRAGIWRYNMNKKGQTLADGERFATGIRNAVAIALQPRTNDLYVVQHGRDQLAANWPNLFNDAKSAETPAEEMFRVSRGDDFGWPYCYHDPELNKKVLAPEYGGDGKTVGRCDTKKTSVATYPGHWAPNSLLFYTGSALPARYRNGAFIVFHGSWNRAPLPQQGFKVVFQPMANGSASGAYEVFVDGFIDSDGKPTALGGRPMALAQGRNGELFLSDDSKGRIWRISYTGAR
jgi:glucose/arabinose dehydrogenase